MVSEPTGLADHGCASPFADIPKWLRLNRCPRPAASKPAFILLSRAVVRICGLVDQEPALA